MGRRAKGPGAAAAEPDPAEAPALDLSEVSVHRLRDRLDAHRDGREEQVVAAAVELRASLDRLTEGLAVRRAALTARAGEIARAAAPLAGGVLAAGIGAVVVARRVRRPPTVTAVRLPPPIPRPG